MPETFERNLALFDVTLPTAEENLALDEALLLAYEAVNSRPEADWRGEALRFWESPIYFVVLGVAGKLKEEIDTRACERDGIRVLRRSSGGGTVLQGPGCLNFSLILALERHPELKSIHGSYRRILERVRSGLEIEASAVRGTSDLAVGNLKFSGNAQKRKRHTLLHHGTLLYGFAADRMARYLREPKKQPDYRRQRPHASFVTNLQLPPEEIKSRVARAWNATPAPTEWQPPPLEELIEEKYGNPAWTEKF